MYFPRHFYYIFVEKAEWLIGGLKFKISLNLGLETIKLKTRVLNSKWLKAREGLDLISLYSTHIWKNASINLGYMLEGIREDRHIKVDCTARHFIEHLLAISFRVICQRLYKRFRLILNHSLSTTKVPTEKKEDSQYPFTGSQPKFLIIFPLKPFIFCFFSEKNQRNKKKKLIHRTFQNQTKHKIVKGNWKSNNPI